MSLLDEARAARDAAHKEQGLLLDAAAGAKRSFTDAEESKFQALNTKKSQLDERVIQLEREARGEAAAANVRRMVGGATTDSRDGVYHRGDNSPSFFGDLIAARSGQGDAIDRLRTNNNEVRTGTALGSYTPGSGDSFAPPLWLSEYVEVARAGGVFSSLVHQEPLPPHTSSVNLPKVRSGASVEVQPAQHTPATEVEPTTELLTSPVTTTAGMSVVSQQMLDQSPIYSGNTFDQIILKDLAADYVSKLDGQVLWGSGGSGQLEG